MIRKQPKAAGEAPGRLSEKLTNLQFKLGSNLGEKHQ